MPKYSKILREDIIEFREYQHNIATEATKKNTLIVIPTALGKTIIAIIALSILIENGGKCIFLAPTRPLVHQHANTIRRFLNIRNEEIVEVTGEIVREERQELYKSGRVIVSTPQVIDNDEELLIGIRKEVVTVIFDEAHRAIGNYAYVKIADFFKDARIIATTASPGGDSSKIDEIVHNLHIEKIEIRDEKSPDVVPYLQGIDVNQVKIQMPKRYYEVVEKLRDMFLDTIGKFTNFSINIQIKSRKDLIALGDVISSEIRKGNKYFFAVARLRTVAIILDYFIEFAETQGLLPLKEYMKETKENNKKAAGLFKDPKILSVERDVDELTEGELEEHTPKMHMVVKILMENQYSKVIIFCHYRLTAEILTDVLRKNGFSCEKFIGQSSRSDGKGMSQKEQSSVIQRFREGETKIIVATQVGEEGLDIPSADTVIFYEPVPSEIRSIQRRGRTGRYGRGKVFILIMENSRDISYLYSASRKEKKMKYILSDERKNVQTTFDIFK
ncbi:MAG: helicase-related protein [Thermoplasmatales archaeon]